MFSAAATAIALLGEGWLTVVLLALGSFYFYWRGIRALKVSTDEAQGER
jgi:hypothetical protein